MVASATVPVVAKAGPGVRWGKPMSSQPEIRNSAHGLAHIGAHRTRMVFGLLTLLTLMAACGGDPEPIRQWRPEDHNHPLAAPTPGTAAPQAPGAGAAAEAEDPAAAELRAARALFNVSCAGCHGRDGSGNGPERPPGAQMPDLRSAALHQGRSDAELTQVIAEGRNMMPSFRDKISGEGIAALLRYVRSLAPSATANGAATTQDGGTNAASKAAAKAAAKAP